MNKQTPLIILLPLVGILEVILAVEDVNLLDNYVYIEVIILSICGYLGLKRDMWLLLTIFYVWVFITDAFIYFPLQASAIESVLFGMLVYWVYRRPERIPSDPRSDTVQLAFYYGDKSPFIAKIMSLLGLPVTGVAVIIGDEAIVPIGKTGKLEKRPRKALRKWIILDTGAGFRNNGWLIIKKLEGKNVGYAGCIKALGVVLEQVVEDYSSTDTPSSLMNKVLAKRISSS